MWATNTRRCRRDSTLLILGLLTLCLGLSTAARADYVESYDKGMAALASEEWDEAAQWLLQAIEENSQAGGRVKAAGKRQLYIPYYHLGMAFYHGGALRKASEAWRQSAIQGKVKKKLWAQVDEYLFEIDARLEEEIKVQGELVSKSAPEPEPELSAEELAKRKKNVEGQFERAERSIERLAAPNLAEAVEQDLSQAALRDQALEKLNRAREIFGQASATSDPYALDEMHALAVDAAGSLERVVMKASLAVRMKAAQEEAEGEGPE